MRAASLADVLTTSNRPSLRFNLLPTHKARPARREVLLRTWHVVVLTASLLMIIPFVTAWT
jgi:hypothetical protein